MKMNRMDDKEYAEYVKSKSPDSPTWTNLIKAFFVGGLICCAGQAIIDVYGALGLSKEDAATATSVTLVFLGAFLTGIGIYDKMAKFAGAGTLVPITGFANAVVSPAMEFKTEGYVLGMSAKMFVIAGPVIVFGISASVVYGIILLIIRSAGTV